MKICKLCSHFLEPNGDCAVCELALKICDLCGGSECECTIQEKLKKSKEKENGKRERKEKD